MARTTWKVLNARAVRERLAALARAMRGAEAD